MRAAFSVREGLASLVRPPEGRLRPLDGLRALAILWVIAFHSGVDSVGVLPPGEYVRLLFSRWMLPVWRGAFGVDVFFVLSGFLIAGLLIDERARTGKVALARFWWRRWLRLFPALFVALSADLATLEIHRDTAWAVLLYVGNFVPVARAAMPWTWSLAIEEQFYLVCPGLLAVLDGARPTIRPWAIGALAALLAVLGGYVAHARGYFPFDVEIVPNRLASRWEAAFDALYTKPWMRAGPLLAGVAAATVYRLPNAMRRLGEARVAGAVGLLVALALGCASTHWQLVAFSSRAVGLVYMATFRTVFGASVAYLLLFALSSHPLGRIVGRALSWRGFWPVAQLSYSAYLLNPVVALGLRGYLGPSIFAGRWSVPSLFLVDTLGTFVAALLVFVLVERPFMQLRPKAH